VLLDADAREEQASRCTATVVLDNRVANLRKAAVVAAAAAGGKGKRKRKRVDDAADGDDDGGGDDSVLSALFAGCASDELYDECVDVARDGARTVRAFFRVSQAKKMARDEQKHGI
jgi:hypothetical protein